MDDDDDENAANSSVAQYTQAVGISMNQDGEIVYPDFQFDTYPGMQTPPDERIGYPLGPVPTDADTTYALPDEPTTYPEMDFRQLVTELDDNRTIPNTTYLTHAIHKHPAIFIPHIPSYLIRQFTTPQTEDGDRPLILDPFSGSGTTGLEAKINGRDYLGVEINPLSRLVSEVATSPIPPTTLSRAEDAFLGHLEATDDRVYEAYNTTFPGQTQKDHWFEPAAIRGLTRIRKALAEFKTSHFNPLAELTDPEQTAVNDNGIDRETLQTRVNRWLTLLIANTVFEVSNADPGVSKAYKSKSMRNQIEAGEHPPDVLQTHREQIAETKGQLIELWNEIYDTDYTGGTVQRTLTSYTPSDIESTTTTESQTPMGAATDGGATTAQHTPVAENAAHNADVDIRLGDARSFHFPEYEEEVDLAITSPPYINAMNYYRGSKLRLFWLYDFLEDDEQFDAEELRQSIVGTHSVSLSDIDRELPATMRSIWTGPEAAFEETRLPHLDADIKAIHNLDHTEAERKAYVTWQFFAEDMLQNLARVYEHLKPGGYYFVVIGENTIGERLIYSHKYLAEIAQHLGRFDGHGGDFDSDDGFRVVGSAWDSITNRDLFQSRNHDGGVIECEWVTILQKPPQ